MTFEAMTDAERRDAYAEIADEIDPRGEPVISLIRRVAVSEPKRLAVLAASFNPPTNAHLRMAELACFDFDCGEVLLELAKSNVDKGIEAEPLHERLMMLWELAAPREWLSVAVSSHGRFIDKTTAIRRVYPSAEIVFVIGYDTLVRVFDPKYYADRDAELDELFARASFLCANRQDDGIDAIDACLSLPENRRYRDGVCAMPLSNEHAALSSSDARRRLARGDADLSDLPIEVSRYILTRGLYR